MLSRGGGSIVVVGSVNAILPDPPIIDYCATKAALANFAKGLSKELGPQGIRVNVVSPGPVATDLWLAEGGVASQFAAAGETTSDQVVQAVSAGAATGRFTTPQEVADVVLFLAGGRSANITGADVRIDGGYVTTV
jgi:NAD(P)-dependent dehydrogenase (short-subunit alcohol dehydrogenase family)